MEPKGVEAEKKRRWEIIFTPTKQSYKHEGNTKKERPSIRG